MFKLMKMLNKIKIFLGISDKNKVIKNNKILLIFIIILGIFNIYNLYVNYSLNKQIEIYNLEENKIKVERNFFNENIKLNNYSDTRYKITDEGKSIIENIRNIHKSPVLIAEEFQDKDLCAGFIGELSQKVWGKKSIYSIGMQNTNKGKIAKAWELPYFYEAFGGKVLIDLSDKFSFEKKDYLNNIDIGDLKEFFAKSFSEKALFGDIGFLKVNTKYTSFLKNWSSNSHIVKNIGVSDFNLTLSKIDINKSNLENLMKNLGCNKNFLKYIELFENYKILLNDKEIVFYKNDFYYYNGDKSIGDKVIFKYLDKLLYKDITIVHFLDGKSHVNSLLQFTCKQDFFPINVMSINGRMIEKM